MTTKYEIKECNVRNYIIKKFEEIEDYNNKLKDCMLNELYDDDNISYTVIRDNINEVYYQITRVVNDFKYVSN